MKLLNNLAQIVPVKVGIDFRCGDRFVAQHLLDCPKVSAALDEVGGKGMPKRMRANDFIQPYFLHQVFDDRKHHHTAQFFAAPVEKNITFISLLDRCQNPYFFEIDP